MSVRLADHLNESARGFGHGQAGDPGRGRERGAVVHAGVDGERDGGAWPFGRPVRLASQITLLKEEALATCCALAMAEDMLIRLGQLPPTSELSTAFQLLEGRLLSDQALDSSGS